jgi:polyisoprenoid-binding protein YceI
MKSVTRFTHCLLVMVSLTLCSAAWAQWELDSSESTVNFVSIKNNSVGETHSFTSLTGSIAAKGTVQLMIDLNSVETLIPIRNERMRELLFDTVKFPAAKITAQVDPQVLKSAAEGAIVTADVPITITLHGQEKTLTAAVIVVGKGRGRLHVFSAHPVLVNAADFGLEAGITALREVAGLQAISNVVPVTLQLHFVAAD